MELTPIRELQSFMNIKGLPAEAFQNMLLTERSCLSWKGQGCLSNSKTYPFSVLMFAPST